MRIRIGALPPQRTFIIFPARDIRFVELSLFSKTLMVTYCGFSIFQIRGAQEVLDNTHATNCGDTNVIYLHERPETYG